MTIVLGIALIVLTAVLAGSAWQRRRKPVAAPVVEDWTYPEVWIGPVADRPRRSSFTDLLGRLYRRYLRRHGASRTKL
jgi:hypothetical protein